REPLQQLLPVRLQQLGGQIRVGYLAARVHPGVGAPGHGKLVRPLPRPRHGPQRVLDLPLHRPPAPGLLGPAVEGGTVVGEVEADADVSGLYFVTQLGILSEHGDGPAPRRERARRVPGAAERLTRPSTPRPVPRRPRPWSGRPWRPRPGPRRPRPS